MNAALPGSRPEKEQISGGRDDFFKAENRAFSVRTSAGFTVIIPGRTKSIEDCVRESDCELYRIKAKRHSV